MRDNRRDSAQVGALRQVQEDRLSGFVDFGVPGLAILGGNGEGGDQIVRRTRFDEDAPCGAQSAVPGAIGRIIGRYLIGQRSLRHRACHRIGDQSGSYLDIHC